jgi:hypothetical protein
MGTNLIRVMDICMCSFCVCVVLCIGGGLATGRSPVQGVRNLGLRIVKRALGPLIILYFSNVLYTKSECNNNAECNRCAEVDFCIRKCEVYE